jgi:hypothetical protein
MVLRVSLLPQPASARSRDRDSEGPLPNGGRAGGAGGHHASIPLPTITTFSCDITRVFGWISALQMASAALSRRVGMVVAYPPLSERATFSAGSSTRRCSTQTPSRICRGSGRRRSWRQKRIGQTYGSSAAASPGVVRLPAAHEARARTRRSSAAVPGYQAGCVVPLCRIHHRMYDRGEFDLLLHLEPSFRAELAHGITHVELVALVRRVTGAQWKPIARPTPSSSGLATGWGLIAAAPRSCPRAASELASTTERPPGPGMPCRGAPRWSPCRVAWEGGP